ncbi:family 1 glycosylhydrolase [Deinococcus sonorensis]|uniref:Family 1 glycosylhydrolase n=2 Tax=Deinococcus sonorensis TaxID=309891 RepID=A0AAU7UDY3_9DEIO
MRLELWVGPEASYTRTASHTLDQQELTGFAGRPEDLDRMASLGASRVRLPLLWERIMPEQTPDWTWSDAALQQLQRLKLDPIAGLVHHGSGPAHTSLLDPAFPEKLADYARRVAERYPHLDHWTPVNEPLTTARFSGLYGHWYPHAQDDHSFVQALLNELRGTVLAMQAVREINPASQLVQTEDLGRTASTPALREQAAFENERRWITWDLLCGRVGPGHPMWSYLKWAGATEEQVMWFAEHPCPPGILGLNLYLTSDRFLDERLDRYPESTHGGNGRQQYADVEAIRVRGPLQGLHHTRLMETHERYGLPMALTEVHLGCTREEQLRWLNAAWQGSTEALLEGADVRALTIWSAFGSAEWNSLQTRQEGHYEPGVWDVSAGWPRETALAQLARELVNGELLSHPVLPGPGWWQRAERVTYPAEGDVQALELTGRPLLLVQGQDELASGLMEELDHLCWLRGLPVVSVPDDGQVITSQIRRLRPWAVVEVSHPQELRLHWLGRSPLCIRADDWDRHALHAALDLLIDGEDGEWHWDGQMMRPNWQRQDGESLPPATTTY